jgi:protein arginine phosphatase
VAVHLREFLAELGVPVVSTSVNRAGEPPVDDLIRIRRDYADAFDFALLYKREYLEVPMPSTVIGFDHGHPVCFRDGAIPFAAVLESWTKPLLLFVCTANICRSPMGEYWLRHLLSQRALPYRTASAGFLPGGVSISENSRLVLLENGIDASAHRSTQLQPEIIRNAWRVLTMTARHRDDLVSWIPNVSHKVFTLSEFAGVEEDVADPYGASLEAYRLTFAMVRERCEKIAGELDR